MKGILIFSGLSIVFAGLAMIVAGVALSRRHQRGATAFGIMMLAVSIYAAVPVVQISDKSLGVLFLVWKIQQTAAPLIGLSFFVFALQYTNQNAWLKRQRLAWISLVPLLAIANTWWSGVLGKPTYITYAVAHHGWFVHVGALRYDVSVYYSYLLLLVGLVLVVRTWAWTNQTKIVTVGIGLPFVVNLVAFMFNFSGFNYTPMAMAIGSIVFGWGIFRFKLLDVVELGHDFVVEGFDEPVLVVDREGYVVDTNRQAAILMANGYDKDLYGKSLMVLDVAQSLREALTEMKETRVDVHHGVGDSRRFYVVEVLVVEEAGVAMGAMAIFHDVTEHRRHSDEVERALAVAQADGRAKSAFLANASHLLRAPLSAVIGYSEVLQSELASSNPTVLADLRKIADAGRNLLGMLSEILEMAKVESGHVSIYVEAFDPVEVLRAIVLRAEQEFSGRAITVTMTETAMIAHQDLEKVWQVVYHVLHNALKFAPEGIVSLNLEESDANIEITVRDTGPGMSKEALDLLFVPFASRGIRVQPQGMGLAMALTDRLLEAIGGTIAVESSPNQGTTVTITIPRTLNEGGVMGLDGAGATILVVDPDHSVVNSVRQAAESLGYQVTGVDTGKHGLSEAMRDTPNIIFVSTLLPDMESWTFLGLLRSDPQLVSVPIVMIQEGIRPEGPLMGWGTDILDKPIQQATLLRVLRTSMGWVPRAG